MSASPTRRRPPPVGGDPGSPPSPSELADAIWIVERSGVVADLEARLHHDIGRPRMLSVKALYIAFQINALRQHNRGHLVQAARVLNSMTDKQRSSLGIGSPWRPERTYKRVTDLVDEIVRATRVTPGWWTPKREGKELFEPDRLEMTTFANRLSDAAILGKVPRSKSVAVDWTPFDTWGALHGDIDLIEPDGEVDPPDEEDEESAPSRRSRTRSARRKRPPTPPRVYGKGPDRRKIYTKDPDARGGWRTATSGRPATRFTGYDFHTAVQTRDVQWHNSSDKIKLGPPVPGIVEAWVLQRANAHAGLALVPYLLDAQRRGHPIKHAVGDKGYTRKKTWTFHHPLRRAGVDLTFELASEQRRPRGFHGKALRIDGALFSPLLPPQLGGGRDPGEPLPMPPRGATAKEKEERYEPPFNQRARWRYGRFAGPTTKGNTRWRCPFHSGYLRSGRFEHTKRLPRSKTVYVPEETANCCSGIETATAQDLEWWQPIPFGTTAWRVAYYGRRQQVENANGGLKGRYVDLREKGYFRVFGLAKITFLLGFAIAAYNLLVCRSFLLSEAAEKAVPTGPRKRRRRLQGTYEDILGPAPEQRAASP